MLSVITHHQALSVGVGKTVVMLLGANSAPSNYHLQIGPSLIGQNTDVSFFVSMRLVLTETPHDWLIKL